VIANLSRELRELAARAQPRQLAFALPHAESLSREDFLEGPGNAAAVELVDRWPDWPGRVVMLVGDAGSGKSHLASIWAANSGARSTTARALTAEAVPGALATGALVIEDIVPSEIDERALFHLLNLARQDEADVLMTARTQPVGWALQLPDLQSRLRAVPVVALAPPDDGLLRALIVKLCIDRQLSVDDALVSYVASRIERSFAAARRAVALLDSEALRLRRPVTRALAAELFRGTAA
jgi:chromosomal replication initiation ATPase DnaA